MTGTWFCSPLTVMSMWGCGWLIKTGKRSVLSPKLGNGGDKSPYSALSNLLVIDSRLIPALITVIQTFPLCFCSSVRALCKSFNTQTSETLCSTMPTHVFGCTKEIRTRRKAPNPAHLHMEEGLFSTTFNNMSFVFTQAWWCPLCTLLASKNDYPDHTSASVDRVCRSAIPKIALIF